MALASLCRTSLRERESVLCTKSGILGCQRPLCLSSATHFLTHYQVLKSSMTARKAITLSIVNLRGVPEAFGTVFRTFGVVRVLIEENSLDSL